MPEPIFCLSRDAALAENLQHHLSPRGTNRAVELLTSGERAAGRMRTESLSTAFVDFRAGHQVSGLTRLFDELETGRTGRMDLVALTDGSLPLELADRATLFAVHALQVPFPASGWNEVSRFVAAGGRINGSRRVPEKRTLQSGELSLTTYCPGMFGTLELLERIAPRDVTILLVGETGTGKSTLAQIVHSLSPRRDGPFHDVACGALPPDRIESELFGRVRGASTGAERDKIGRLEAAGRGTLLLDEIDVLGPREQVQLLRVIETGRFEPVGATETRASQARLIVASHVDLETCVESKPFRSDLYYRLNVLQFRLPALRERGIDVVPLTIRFVRECCREHGVEIARVGSDFLDCVQRHSWPGNLRELKNQIERAVLFNRSGTLRAADLAATVRRAESPPGTGAEHDRSLSLAERIAASERRILIEELHRHNQCRTSTAKSLGISRVGLYKKMRKHGIL